jgi:NAD(P)-dependent dehydrogenase (short-subunit alcohol dehydrogenase family)
MIEAVTLAEQHALRKTEERAHPIVSTSVSVVADPLTDAVAARAVTALRGALARAAGHGPERGPVVALRTSSRILSFLERPNVADLVARGCATPDHVIRTKPWALHVGGDSYGDSFGTVMDDAIASYARRYDAYFDEQVASKGVTKKKLDPWPRIILLPGVGVCAVGKTAKDAAIAADVYEHTIQVIEDAERVGSYAPVGFGDLFDVEYWSLEQAKLKKEVDQPLSARVALVTGAASGIGRATAALFAELGAHVVLCDRDEPGLRDAAVEIGRSSQLATSVCDVTKPADVERAFRLAACRFGGVDVVVSNAGSAAEGKLETHEGEAALRASLELNLMSHLKVAQSAVETMKHHGRGGCLLFNASKSAFNQGPGFGPYALPKAALVSLMRQYAVDLAAHGIRSNAVNADRIRTNIFAGGMVESRAAARGITVDEYFRSNLLGREVTARDVAEAFAWLAQAKATTGCVVTVDGGNAAAFPR